MAKSVSIFLVLFVVAVSLDGAHRASAFRFAPIVDELPAVSKAQQKLQTASLEKFHKEGEKIFENTKDTLQMLSSDDDDENRGSTALPTGLYYVMVADIMVGEMGSRLGIGPETGVIVSTTIPFVLLDKEAYGLLKNKLPEGDATSDGLDAQWRQLCYTSATAVPQVTLVLAVNNAETTMVNFWYKQNGEGSMCLGILPSPLT